MSGAFEAAWALLKSVQTELGQHHPDLPSSQGPVLGYHGRNFSIRHQPFGEELAWGEFHDILENQFGGDRDAMQDVVGRRKANELLHTGLVPTDVAESQIGSGRYHQHADGKHDYSAPVQFNPDVPPAISVAVEPDTAAAYAEGRSGYKDSSGQPGYYGIRAGAMQNALPLDAPFRRYKIGDTDDYIYNTQRYRFIPHGIAPNQMVRFPSSDSMREFDLGNYTDYSDFSKHPSRFIGVGPGQFLGRDQKLVNERKMTMDEFKSPERDTQRVMESEQFIQDQLAQYQQQQLAQQQAMAQREADRQAEEAFRQQQMAATTQQQLPIGVQ